MSKDNPIAAVDALLETDTNNASTHIHPMTIARYALLELVESPIVMRSQKVTIESIIPTLYIMTAGVEELKGYNSKNIDKLKDAAFVWADEQTNLSIFDELLAKTVDKTKELNTVAPSDGKKAMATPQQMAG